MADGSGGHGVSKVRTLSRDRAEASGRNGSTGTVYESLREMIVGGAVSPNARLVVSDLAAQLGTSTNPVREALRQLSGEGFVVLAQNRGARVRAIDAAFVRDVIEIEMLVEPYMTRWFAGIVTSDDIDALQAIQDEIEANAFEDTALHTRLDTRFHSFIYDRHYNAHARDLWWKHREIISAISRRQRFSLERKDAVIREHRQLLSALEKGDAETAAAAIATHVRGSGDHVIDRMGNPALQTRS